MIKNLIPIIQHRHTTKFFSLFLGYFLWFCIAQYQTITQTYQTPIYFYDADNKKISSPENIQITVQGPRKEMYRFHNSNHATVQIDGTKLSEGKQEIMINKENLFLPDGLKLIDLVPSHINIKVDLDKNI